jgi:hypothetical protein
MSTTMDNHFCTLLTSALAVSWSLQLYPKNQLSCMFSTILIISLWESDLTTKLYRDVFDSIVIEKMISISKKRKSIRSFSLYDTESALYIIILGYVCSLVVLLGEIVWKLINK